MQDRRWPIIGGIVVAVLLIAAVGWAAGRSSAPESSAQAKSNGEQGAIKRVDGVPVGVQRTRAGALAAADNYVAVGSETVLQDPTRYATLVRQTYEAEYQPKALREAQAARNRMTNLAAQYAEGRTGLALIAARRLDDYSNAEARVTTWTVGVNWGPGRAAGQRWFFTETSLRWIDDRWRVVGIDESDRAAPTPGVVRYSEKAALKREAFERDLNGMTAPTYGVDAP